MLLLLLGLMVASTPAQTFAEDEVWPQWRGPTGNSIAPGRSLPTQIDKHILWKVPLPGWGNSTPAIWREAVFVTSQDQERLLLLRLERESGKIVWEREVSRGSPRRQGPVGNGRFHDENNMASPSPVTDGKHVWAHFGDGTLACYDFDGSRVWSVRLPEQHGPYTVWWGHANSPVLAGDVIVSACMQDPKGGGQSYVVAHDKATGKERWFVPRDTGAKEEPADAYTTPVLYEHAGRTEVILFGGNVLDAYEPATGKRLWHCHAFSGNRVISGPTVVGDTVYAIQGMRGPLVAVKAGGEGDVTKSHVLWKFTGGTPDAPSPLVTAGLVFLATNPGIALCVDAATGREVWKLRLGDGFRASPLAADGKVYFFSKEGTMTVVAAARELTIVGRGDLGEEIIASPAAAAGSLFIRTKGHLYRVGTK